MQYVTEAEFIEAFGLELTIELTNLEDPQAMTVNSAVLQRHITTVSGMIDGYLSARFCVEAITEVPQLLKAIALDMVRYKAGHYAKEDDVRQRYEDALSQLKQIANGSLNLGLPCAPPPAQLGSPASHRPRRVFDDTTLGLGQPGGFL